MEAVGKIQVEMAGYVEQGRMDESLDVDLGSCPLGI